MITARNVRRALLRACPLSLVGLIGGLALGLPFAEAVALALFGAAPAAMFWLELRARTWPDPTTRRSQIKLALLGWALAFVVFQALVIQAVYAHAKLSARDPLIALTSFGPPVQELAWQGAFAALSLAAATCLLVGIQHRSTAMLADLDGPDLHRPSMAGLAVLAAGWLLLLLAPVLTSPGGVSGEEALALLVFFGGTSGVALAVATPFIAALCVLADGVEESLWPKRT